MSEIYSNIVPQNKVRQIQKETLQIIANSLTKSFGPMGSSTAIVTNSDKNGVNIALEYTKDGHTIVKNIRFNYPIERSIQDLLVDLTRYVVKEVGDGTTSAILLCNSIYKCLCENNAFVTSPPSDIISKFNEVIQQVNEKILAKGRECTLDDIYDIALISTNNNVDIAMTLKNVYEKYGLETYIDVGTSNEIFNIIKDYDGMTLETGFSNICFINNRADNSSIIKNPKVYSFKDPIDTPEMISFMDVILDTNIINPVRENRSNPQFVPTVILCKKITPDASSYLESVVKLMNNPAYKDQIPLLIVSDIHQDYLFEDISMMCCSPFIKKYLNPELQEKDQEVGLAPTLESVINFCGGAELIEATSTKTKIIKPAKMFKKDGSYSEEYDTHVQYLEKEIERLKAENADLNDIGQARRRLNSFKGHMVDFLVGGITLSDKQNLKAAVEDAVLNCRSAVKYGVGYGANFMALSVLKEIKDDLIKNNDNNTIVNILYDSYVELASILYSSMGCDAKDIIDESIKNDCPLNIRTNKYDHKVLSSIRSDVVILETINKIMTLMYTCNQYLVQTPVHNIYIAEDRD